jgi:SAM-dependent methyltransferase
MIAPDQQTADFYEETSNDLSRRYESAAASTLFPHIFPAGESVFDIGCGSGRDLAALLAQGLDVAGLDASKTMLAEAQRLHPELAGRLYAGSLPGTSAGNRRSPLRQHPAQRRFDAHTRW